MSKTEKPQKSPYQGRVSRGEDEPVLAFVERRIVESPEWDAGDIRVQNGSVLRRSSRVYEFGRERVTIGGHELFQKDLDNEPRFSSFIPDVSGYEMQILSAEIEGKPFVTREVRLEQRRKRAEARREEQVHGTRIETATPEQKAARALQHLQGDDPTSRKMRAALLRELAAEEEAAAEKATAKA